MKLIMENWKIYLQESESININPDGKYGPEFLQGDLDENLEESDQAKDPESLTLKELEETSAKDIQETYATMAKNEPSRSAERHDLHHNLKKKHKIASNDLTRSINVEGVFAFFEDKIKDLLNTILSTDFETIAKKSQRVKDTKLEVRQLILKEFTPLQREIIRAIFVFTGLNVSSVRDPNLFDEEDAQSVLYLNDGIEMYFRPTRETYKKAKIILEKLQETPLKDAPTLWRGLSVAVKTDEYPGLDKYKVGATLNVGNVMSFSLVDKVALRFASKEVSFPWSWPIVLQIEKGDLKRGVDVDHFSQFEGEEKEIITGGNFTIKEIKSQTKKGGSRVSHKNFKEAWEHLGWKEAWKMAIDNEPDEMFKFFEDLGGDPRKWIFIVKIKQNA